MNSQTEFRHPEVKEGDRIGDHEVRRIVDLPEINARYIALEHGPAGAKHVHISRDDRENTFSVAFKTVPTDSTGVAHILEHTTLCGSQKFRVRDPFFSMIKRSLNTFMNAFTASDWTMYPFCTQNRKDYYNLMDVYLDAAFYPELSELNFKQEGHRLELEGGRLVYKGVVYNEMKGAMSSPDQVMVRSLMNALYPDTTYRNNSGGEPSDIPRLTHAQLAAFHRRHYHPSNAFFYTYGDLPLTDHLAFIQEKVLGRFSRIDPGTNVPTQPRWQAPKTVSYPYPLSPSEDPEKKYQVSVAWLTADIQSAYDVLVLSLLGEILMGNAASPLRKALIDSGLGSSLADGTGYDADNRDTLFACGLKDVKAGDAGTIEGIILNTLTELVRTGIDGELIEAAIHQLEFHRKEVTNSPYPYGLKLMLAFSAPWFHGADPVRSLRFDDDLSRLKAALAAERVFEEAIRRFLTDNPHRVLFTLVPDQKMAHAEESRTAAELARILEGLTPTELARIEADQEALTALQETEEDLSVLPTLEIEDIPPSIQTVAPASPFGPGPVTWYAQPTSGILYFTAASGVAGVSGDLVPLVPFFCYAFPKIGTAKRDYAELARLLDMVTGGVGLSAHTRTRYGGERACLPFVTLSGKCLVRNQDKMFDILAELLHHFNFADLARLKTLFLEYRANMESMIVRNGHSLAISLASRNFSVSRALSETWQGVHQLRAIKDLTEDLTETRLAEISGRLVAIGRAIFTRKNLKIALVGEDSALAAAVSPVSGLIAGLEDRNGGGFAAPEAVAPAGAVPREGWSTGTAVSFVARSFETAAMGHPDAPALAVIGKMLRSLYLHREIREKGGAYGGFSIYNPEDGLFCLGSYRDPHVVNTLRVYDQAGPFIRSGRFTDDDVKEAILQVCSDIDKPDPPGPAARKAFIRQLVGLNDDLRREFKARLLEVDPDQIRAAADRYFDGGSRPQAVAVISSEEKLKSANAELAERPLTLHQI
ncbi:insulinase family protein [Desulfococcus sp.]|uniref:insulinase family protein n=1 Tax=Desulfococcus sp. TaxID=2025834 RepID=UPI003592F4CB